MSDMRSIGTALGAYQVDYAGYPAGNGSPAEPFKFLSPDYMIDPPLVDGWGNPLRYEAPMTDAPFAQSYTLSSAGSDGVFQGYRRSTTKYFDCDLIYGNGQFLASPSGVCKE